MDAPPARPEPATERPDPLRRLWGPVTVRCAWELLLAGASPRGAVLRHAREHALWAIPTHAGVAEAEGIATAAVKDLLARQRGSYQPWSADPDLSILPAPRWREAIAGYVDPVHDAVFRLHYADGLSMADVERRTGLDRSTLRAAQGAIVELAREVLVEDGIPVHDWDAERLDRLVHRVATAAGDACPGPGGLATDQGRAHAAQCPRCSRAMRLLREGILSPSDLFAPADGPVLPKERTEVWCIHLHPDARKHRAALLEVLPEGVIVLNRDVFLVEVRLAADLGVSLVRLAEDGTPRGDQLRIVRRPLIGRIVGGVVLGFDVLRVVEETLALEWGATLGTPNLPEPLPPPPSAARWWMTAFVVAVSAVAAGTWTLLPKAPKPDEPLSAERTADGIRFDTDDGAYVDVLSLDGSTLTLVFHSATVEDKGSLATGDGRYQILSGGGEHLVIARAASFEGIQPLLDGFTGTHPDIHEVQSRLWDRFPGVAIVVVP